MNAQLAGMEFIYIGKLTLYLNAPQAVSLLFPQGSQGIILLFD